ncbi:MAG: hypothetical protein JSV30_04695 [Candidatus Omnitrophota bacterium]|nr:MAG: hypothetical protein JSV30_04695 [Candidatus Omnitrophota bacterium]
MTKKKVDISKEVALIWQEAKENLKALGQRTLKLAQKGEKGVVRASKVGKFQLDIVSLNLSKENVFRQIGKKVYEMHASKKAGIETAKLTSLFNQIDKINRQVKTKKSQIAKLKREHK